MKKNDQYTYRVFWSEEDQEFVGTCVEFPSLSWLDGSPEAAVSGIRKVVARCIGDIAAEGGDNALAQFLNNVDVSLPE